MVQRFSKGWNAKHQTLSSKLAEYHIRLAGVWIILHNCYQDIQSWGFKRVSRKHFRPQE
jgi:hypothetical protein